MPTVKEILKRKKEREVLLEVSLKDILRQICELGALKVYHFGSSARGEVDTHSDLDLLIVMPATKSGKEWMKLLYGTVEKKVASDMLVYNQKEFERDLSSSRFLQNVIKGGKVVYEKI